ncbi:MAG TPA: lactate utilization protein [Chitinophagaceae bacterium]|nr:lactate utilization protein [Chitinophagaceae bacterium]
MKISPSKENILKNIRKALSQSTPLPFPLSEGNNSVFKPLAQELEVEFAEQFIALQGRFIFCVNRQELAFQFNSLIKKQSWQKVFCAEANILELVGSQSPDRFSADDLADCDVSVTSCEFLVARTGSIVMSAAQAMGRTASVYAPVHICIAFSNQLIYDVKDALQLVKEKYKDKIPSLITFATGPSRTADIEKTLVVGVHGPKEVYCFLVDA